MEYTSRLVILRSLLLIIQSKVLIMRSIIPGEIQTKDLHQYILGAIAPRPIAFVSTIDNDGVPNIAPYSFFNAFSSNPPVLVFSSNRTVDNNTTKDTLHNIQLNQELVVNVVNYKLVRQMSLASISYPPQVDEFAKAGLTPLPSDLVKPFRIKESPVHFECKVSEIITLGEHGGAGHLIICDVLKVHISESVIDENDRIDPHKIDLVGRMGRAHYIRASGAAVFDVYQNVAALALGFDRLPNHLVTSSVLTGGDLAEIAGLLDFPDAAAIQQQMQTEAIKAILKKHQTLNEELLKDLHLEVKKALDEKNVKKAFQIAMVFENIG